MAKNHCFDCEKRILPKGWFMVKNDLWQKYGVEDKFLCMDCFEKRIGRKLEASDLIKYYVNEKVNPNTINLLKKNPNQ